MAAPVMNSTPIRLASLADTKRRMEGMVETLPGSSAAHGPLIANGRKALTTESQRAQRKNTEKKNREKNYQKEDRRRRPRICPWLLFFYLSFVFPLSLVLVLCFSLCPL
jgi:hypothetical protein